MVNSAEYFLNCRCVRQYCNANVRGSPRRDSSGRVDTGGKGHSIHCMESSFKELKQMFRGRKTPMDADPLRRRAGIQYSCQPLGSRLAWAESGRGARYEWVEALLPYLAEGGVRGGASAADVASVAAADRVIKLRRDLGE